MFRFKLKTKQTINNSMLKMQESCLRCYSQEIVKIWACHTYYTKRFCMVCKVVHRVCIFTSTTSDS